MILAATLLAASIVLAAAALTHPNFGTAAEWAAAVFGGAAVMAAIWIANTTARNEAARNHVRAIICAHKIAPYVISFNNRVVRAKAYFESTDGGLDDIALGEFANRGHSAFLFEADLPDSAFIDAWALPPDVAVCCVALQAYIRQYHSYAIGWCRYLGDIQSTAEVAKKRDAFLLGINKSIELSNEALKGLTALIE